jgi:hypothetical protein
MSKAIAIGEAMGAHSMMVNGSIDLKKVRGYQAGCHREG